MEDSEILAMGTRVVPEEFERDEWRSVIAGPKDFGRQLWGNR